jgi:hypothetical protein
MKEKTLICGDSPRNVVYSMIRGVCIDTIRASGPLELIFKILRDHRLTNLNPKPYANLTLKINGSLLKKHTGKKFYQYRFENFRNLYENRNFLIFYSEDGIGKLLVNSTWSVDGTFFVVSKLYFQLFTVSYIKDHHVFPAVFILLKNKL